MPDLPLSGYRVVDFTANMSGPFATQILGDQGADVVKVEAPGGDVIRTIGTGRAGMSGYFANLNRSKRSVVVDLVSNEGRRLADQLIDSADVVVQNFRPAVTRKLGLDGPSVRNARPGLVYAGIVGFGQHGPFAGRPAYDHVIQALSGFAARQADPKAGVPTLVRQGIVDKATGQATAQAVTAALLQRARTGVGRELSVSMLDVALSVLWPDGMMNHTLLDPEYELPAVANSFRLSPTLDGFVSFTAVTSGQWSALLGAVGCEAAAEEQAGGMESRMRRGGEMMRVVAGRVAELTTADVLARMSAAGVPCAPVLSLDEIPSHPQVVANGSLCEFDHPVLGRSRQPNPPVDFGAGRTSDLRAAPTLGQHTAEVLGELGLSAADIEDLNSRNIVHVGTKTGQETSWVTSTTTR